jgi:two-component sensor histidine kinase
MHISTFLEPIHLLQTIALALSIFNLATFLWLALTVWLNGDHSAGIARLGVVGLGLSAVFFFIQALLITSPPVQQPELITQEFLWYLLWLPALGVPYIWFAIGLHYAALINTGWRRRRPLMLIVGGALGCTVLLLLAFNSSTFTFTGTIGIFSLGAQFVVPSNVPALSIILIPILFLCYVTFCAIGPWFTFGRISRLLRVLWHTSMQYLSDAFQGKGDTPLKSVPKLHHALVDAFWDDPTDVEMLEEPVLSWHLARPGLLLAALLMVGLTTTLGILVIQSVGNWLDFEHQHILSPLHASPTATTTSGIASKVGVLPLNLIILDLLTTGAVAVIILLLGYSVMRHGILIERPLARRGFLEQWRGIVIVATTVAIFIALLVNFTNSDLGGLLLITMLATIAYALFTWSSYTAHDRFIALLRPFVRSSSLRHWLNTDLQKTEQDLKNVFFHLCHNVLAVECAYLNVMAGTVRRSFSYRWPADTSPTGSFIIPKKDDDRVAALSWQARDGAANRTPKRIQIPLRGRPMICWVLPIYDERGLVATLYLGPREDGAALTDEDMNLAHACGQRILDALGDHEAMQAVAGLLRRRTVDVKLLDAQQRRLLHDEILPQMHLALLRLETLRALPSAQQEAEDVTLNGHNVPSSNGHDSYTSLLPSADSASYNEKDVLVGTPWSEASAARFNPVQPQGSRLPPLPYTEQGSEASPLNEAIDMISDAHRRLAAMMRATAPSAPHRLERDGLMQAIHAMLEQDFQNAFDEVDWCVSDETAAYIDEVTPPAIAELIFAAVQEALRNAARHARGSDVHRRLRLLLKASWNPDDCSLEIIVADDGVGITSASSSTTGTGGGLLTHSALLAIAGGNLTIKSAPDEGVTVRILLPAESLR